MGSAGAGRRAARTRPPKRLALVAVCALTLLTAATCSSPGPQPSRRAEPTVSTPSPSSSGGEWGQDVTYLATRGEFYAGRFHGSFYAGSRHWEHLDGVDLFTVLESGLVYVAPRSRDIVWEGWQHQTRTIGHRPWVGTGPERTPYPVGVIGNPDADLVAWVETAADNTRGDIVVVDGSTGTELARTPFTADPGGVMLLAAIDAEHLWFATVPTHPVWEENPRWHTWLWEWRDGKPELRPGNDRLLDAGGDVLAVDDAGRLRFEDWEGHLLSTVPAWYWDGMPFGRALSPDGKVWLADAAGRFVSTATGKGVVMDYPTADDPLVGTFAWIRAGAAAFAHRNHGLWICDGSTGACSDPAAVPGGDDSPPALPRN
jgi:hypothetical protein